MIAQKNEKRFLYKFEPAFVTGICQMRNQQEIFKLATILVGENHYSNANGQCLINKVYMYMETFLFI